MSMNAFANWSKVGPRTVPAARAMSFAMLARARRIASAVAGCRPAAKEEMTGEFLTTRQVAERLQVPVYRVAHLLARGELSYAAGANYSYRLYVKYLEMWIPWPATRQKREIAN